MDFENHEFEIKQRVGFVSTGVSYYSKKKIKSISKVTKSFYSNWDEKSYEKYMKMFSLDENKTPYELSAGMKVKYALVLALSHNADLLILDEPTSGLDPVSRDDLLDVFMSLCDEGKTILFSTHITSDLDKCADQIVYIKKGEIIFDDTMKVFESEYKEISFSLDEISKIPESILIGKKRAKEGFTALIKTSDLETVKSKLPTITISNANLETVMVHIEKDSLVTDEAE